MPPLPEALGEALSAREREYAGRDWSRPSNIRSLASDLARAAGAPARSANRLLAAELGVTIRTVQRWTTETASQRRAVRAPQQEQLRTVARQAAPAAVARDLASGFRVKFTGEMSIQGYPGLTRTLDEEIDEDDEDFAAFIASIQAGDLDGAAELLSEMAAGAYLPDGTEGALIDGQLALL